MTRRTNASIAGITFLLYIAIGITQMVVARGMSGGTGPAEQLALMAQHATQVRINIALTLLMCATAFTLAVTLFGITRDVDRDLSVLGMAFRLGESMFAALAPLLALSLLWLATAGAGEGALDTASVNTLGALLMKVRGWNVTLSATLFSFGSLIFCQLMLRGRLIPAPLAWLGVLASVLLVIGLPLQIVGVLRASIVQFLWLPMAAFEIPLGVWLILKGVRAPVAA